MRESAAARRGAARWALLLVSGAVCVAPAPGQVEPTAAEPGDDLPDEVRGALAGVEDFSFSFAQAGFFALLEHVKRSERPPGATRAPIVVSDWRALLERPADFRGLPVAIEGVVGRNKAWQFEQEAYRALGPVWQLELWRAGQPVAATVIVTQDAGAIPVGATVRVVGYFVMVRQYYAERREGPTAERVRQALLIVAPRVALVAAPPPPRDRAAPGRLVTGAIVSVTAALLVLWLLLRRSVACGGRARGALRASGPAPMSLADDLAAWAREALPEERDEAPPVGDQGGKRGATDDAAQR